MSNKFENFLCDADQTIPISVEDSGPEELKASPKRGRPRKQKQPSPEESYDPVPDLPKPSAPKAPPPKIINDQFQVIFDECTSWKNSKVFGPRLEHINLHPKMSLPELIAAKNSMKAVISGDFSRHIVEGFFTSSVDMTETFMVHYMEWDHAVGIAEDIKNEKSIFQDELEELSLQMSNKVQLGPMTRLIGKLGFCISKHVNQRLQSQKNTQVEIKI